MDHRPAMSDLEYETNRIRAYRLVEVTCDLVGEEQAPWVLLNLANDCERLGMHDAGFIARWAARIAV